MSLVHQALSLDHTPHTNPMFSSQLHKFLDAHFERDYVNLLGNILQHFRLVYIIVEAGAMMPGGVSRCQEHLLELSQRLSEQHAATVVKIMALSYGPDIQHLQSKENIVLKTGKTSHRKGKKLPCEPLESLATVRVSRCAEGV